MSSLSKGKWNIAALKTGALFLGIFPSLDQFSSKLIVWPVWPDGAEHCYEFDGIHWRDFQTFLNVKNGGISFR